MLALMKIYIRRAQTYLYMVEFILNETKCICDKHDFFVQHAIETNMITDLMVFSHVDIIIQQVYSRTYYLHNKTFVLFIVCFLVSPKYIVLKNARNTCQKRRPKDLTVYKSLICFLHFLQFFYIESIVTKIRAERLKR